MARTKGLFLLCAILLLSVSSQAGKENRLPAGVEKAATISALLQEATVVRRSPSAVPPFKASRGMELTWNDVVQTDPNGRVRIRMLDNSLLSIGAHTELRITGHDPQSHKTQVELAYGLFRAQIKKLATGESFEVRTPTAVAGVIGTDFGVDASDPEHVKFICLEGTVRISSLDPNNPGTVNCEAGHKVTVDQGKTPSAPTDVDTAQSLIRWRNITDPEAANSANSDAPPY